jgi:hypothetical protein
MKKAAAALAIVLALTATASARPQHHHQSSATGSSTIDSGYGPPRTWNGIEQSTPGSGGYD